MRKNVLSLALLIAALSAGIGWSGDAAPAADEAIAGGLTAAIDGQIAGKEYEGATAVKSGGTAIHLQHDAEYLYVAAPSDDVCMTSLFVSVGRQVYVFHASARLGCAIYESGPEADGWRCTQGFTFEAMSPEYLEKHGWWGVAGDLGEGKRNVEFAIRLSLLQLDPKSLKGGDRGALRVAMNRMGGAADLYWPEGLQDDTGNMDLLCGNAGETATFRCQDWGGFFIAHDTKDGKK